MSTEHFFWYAIITGVRIGRNSITKYGFTSTYGFYGKGGLYFSKLLPCLIQELLLFSYLRHKLMMSFFACCRARNIIKICRDILLLTARLDHNLKISFSSSEDIGFSRVPKITFCNMAMCVIL